MRKVVAVDDQQWRLAGHVLPMIADTIPARMQAEVVFRDAAIYTMDRRQPRARHLAVGGGRILACSTEDPLDHLIGPATRIIHGRGRAIVPGFVDAHVHFGHFALARQEVNLDPAQTLEDGARILRAAAEHLEPGRWLRGRGWDRNRWGRLPTRADLDAAVGDRPAGLSSHDGHSLWLSSAALRAVGLDRNTSDPSGGVIERHESGEPTGVLLEHAQDLVRDKIPDASDHEIYDALLEALEVAAAAGITGIHNLEDARSRRTFQALDAAGELGLRVYHGVPRGELKHARERGLRSGDGSDRLRTGPVKLFSDGALGSRTAHMLEPYEGRAQDGYRGVPTMTPDELQAEMRVAAGAGLDVAVHAIGDAAVRAALDAYEQARAAYPPLAQRLLRIEHAQLVDPRDVPRFAQLGAIASMQPIHATADWRTADTHWGERSRHGYAWRNLLQAGATLAFGTDAPVESIEPLKGLYAATTRRDPSGEPTNGWYPAQCLALEEAVAAYTVGSASAERAAGRRGRLIMGMDADLVLLTPDPFPLEPAALLETRVELTMVAGRVVYDEAT